MTEIVAIRDLLKELGSMDNELGVIAAARLWDGLLGPMNEEEAANYLNYQLRTIRNKACNHEIPYHKIPKTVFLRSEIMETILNDRNKDKIRVA